MKIESLEIKKFKFFKTSGIKEFSMNMPSPIQIIIGRNSSGKSSLLGEIVPLSPQKPTYEKKGYKRIVLEKDSNIFELVTDFGNSKINSFIMNGNELNLSGISTIQNELCQQYLGYTPLVHDLTHFKYHISRMSKSDRKNLFLEVNPVDLGLILNKHKLVSSNLRECKSNINLLSTRELELKAKILDKELLEQLSKNKENKLTEYNSLSTTISLIDQDLKNTKQELEEFINTKGTPESVGKGVADIFRGKVNKFLYDYSIPKDVDSRINRYQIDIATTKRSIDSVCSSMENVVREITKHKEYLEKNSNEVSTYELGKSIASVEEHIRNIGSVRENDIIPENLISYIESTVISNLYTAISVLQDSHPKRILNSDELSRLRDKCNTYIYKQQNINNILEMDVIELDKLQGDISELRNNVFKVEENCNKCVLYLSNKKKIDDLSPRVTFLESRIKDNRLLQIKYSKIQDILMSKVNMFESLLYMVRDVYQWSTKIFSYQTLAEVISILEKDINIFKRDISTTIENTKNYYKKRDLEKVLNDYRNKYEILQNTPSIGFIRELLTTKEKEKDYLETQLVKYQKDLDLFNLEISKDTKYKKMLDKLEDISNKINIYLEYTKLTKSIEFATLTLSQLNSKRDDLLKELQAIDQQLNEQKSIINRLEEEIYPLLKEVKNKKEIYELLEYGLSPSKGFPHKHLITHMNSVINNVNCLIEQVWSYPLRVLPLSEENDLDYTFSVILNDDENNIVSDVSKLSKGQQVVVNIAFNIAIMLSMKLNNYPLFLDECDEGSLDPLHTQKFVDWLKSLIDNNFISQLFIISHDVTTNESFITSSDICCLSDDVPIDTQIPINANVNIKK